MSAKLLVFNFSGWIPKLHNLLGCAARSSKINNAHKFGPGFPAWHQPHGLIPPCPAKACISLSMEAWTRKCAFLPFYHVPPKQKTGTRPGTLMPPGAELSLWTHRCHVDTFKTNTHATPCWLIGCTECTPPGPKVRTKKNDGRHIPCWDS